MISIPNTNTLNPPIKFLLFQLSRPSSREIDGPLDCPGNRDRFRGEISMQGRIRERLFSKDQQIGLTDGGGGATEPPRVSHRATYFQPDDDSFREKHDPV